jgi:two-component system sensor histidine kinase TorS
MAQIMVVDDVPGVRQSIVSILKRAGHDVEAVEDGFEAVKKAADYRPDVVVTDVMMPGIDGVETMDRLKAILPAAKFIAVSGGGSLLQAEDALRLAASMANATLSKPFTNAELVDTVNEVLGDA